MIAIVMSGLMTISLRYMTMMNVRLLRSRPPAPANSAQEIARAACEMCSVAAVGMMEKLEIDSGCGEGILDEFAWMTIQSLMLHITISIRCPSHQTLTYSRSELIH